MKILLFLFVLCIAIAGASAMYITDTVFYAAGTNTSVYVKESTWISSTSINANQINFTDLWADKYIYDNRGTQIYVPTMEYKNLSFSDGMSYTITSTGTTTQEINNDYKEVGINLTNGLVWIFLAFVVVFVVGILYAAINGNMEIKSGIELISLIVIIIIVLIAIGVVGRFVS